MRISYWCSDCALPIFAVQFARVDTFMCQERQGTRMDRPGRLTSRTHRFPACRSQVVEGRFRQDGTAGVTGTKKQNIHVVAFAGVGDRSGKSSSEYFEAVQIGRAHV